MLAFFFFNDTATTEIYTLSLHDALPILERFSREHAQDRLASVIHGLLTTDENEDRKSTRLNSSHGYISYAVFCLKKKKQTINRRLNTRIRETKIRHEMKRSAIKTSNLLL